MDAEQAIKDIISVDIFRDAKLKENFAGRPFYIDYEMLHMLVADSWKMRVGGLQHGSFLLAFYENEESVHEALLLRVLKPVKLPTDVEVISSMVEYYKDNLKTSGKDSKLDDFTRYEFSFSGLECRILGTFYKDQKNKICFGADVENFYSANNYSVYKSRDKILEMIVNFRDGECISGSEIDERIGIVRYSSSRRFQEKEEVPVYVYPKDFLGKRTALFGMTRTGKSNTVKKIVQITEKISRKAMYKNLNESSKEIEPFTKDGRPMYPVGQIIFDINGEYANPNMQDKGTAIFEIYSEKVIRYSVLEKKDFKVMKVNFYNDITEGFELIQSHLSDDSNYVNNFKTIDLTLPEDASDYSAQTRYKRIKAAYLCCLYKAGLKPSKNNIQFKGNADLNKIVQEDGKINPEKGITFEEAINWFSTIWDNSNNPLFAEYKNKNGHDWIDDNLKALLIFLTRKTNPGPDKNPNISGYLKLREMKDFHTPINEKPFDVEIIEALRARHKII
ncbi:MAG: ATP-binding protein [Methanosarcina barkeri]|nr:ATP-binding protein [Methanosarcina sp. ERenArc_MAG2]